MQWEYWTLKIQLAVKTGVIASRSIAEEEIDQQLNEAGKNGWELIHAVGLAINYGQTSSVLYTFKRPKS